MKEISMEWVIAGLAFVAGGAVGVAVVKSRPVETPAVVQQEVIKQLTNLDLILPLCNPEQIEKTGEMCRYLACLQFSRGVDAQTGGNGECERIGNVISKKSVYDYCSKVADNSDVVAIEWDRKVKECVEFFDRRL
tara:strand:+ start:563 stop:967 length:405 start_codon:yes stop_codon:yes gene_type:complete